MNLKIERIVYNFIINVTLHMSDMNAHTILEGGVVFGSYIT